MVGALFYAAGLILMAWSSTPLAFDLTAGALVNRPVRLRPSIWCSGLRQTGWPEKQPMAFGLGSAAGSFRAVPVLAARRRPCRGLWLANDRHPGCVILAIIPLSLAVASPPAPVAAGSAWRAIVVGGPARSHERPLLRSADARFLHLRFSARLRHRPLPRNTLIESGLPADRLLGLRARRHVQRRRVAVGGLAEPTDAAPLYPVAIYLARSASTVLFILLPPSTAGVCSA